MLNFFYCQKEKYEIMRKDKRSSIFLFCSNFTQRNLKHFVVFSLLWFLLTGPEKTSWFIGLPTVFFATALSLKLAPSSRCRISPANALRFIPFFLSQSFLGGIDVMRRALSPPRFLKPRLVCYTTFLPEGSARIFFVNTISLLPGTLSAKLQANNVTIHILDQDPSILNNIQSLEQYIDALIITTE